MTVGANLLVTCCDAPAAIVPLVQFGENTASKPLVNVIPLTASVEFPLFVMVSVAIAVCPTATFPNAKFPTNPIIRVGVGAVGEVGDEPVVLLPPQDAAKMTSNAIHQDLNVDIFLA